MPDGGGMQVLNLNSPRLCHEREIPEGKARGFDLHDKGTDSLFLVRFEGQIYAWRNACPHIHDAPMAWRKDGYMNPAGTHVVCHAHGARFAPDSGLCVGGACLGRSLTPVAIETDDQGWVQLRITTTNE